MKGIGYPFENMLLSLDPYPRSRSRSDNVWCFSMTAHYAESSFAPSAAEDTTVYEAAIVVPQGLGHPL